MATSGTPLLDEKEIIEIFVDTLKNPCFNRIVGLQLQFFVNLIITPQIFKYIISIVQLVKFQHIVKM